MPDMTRKQTIAALVTVGVLALAIWGYWAGSAKRAAEAERERPVKSPSRVSQVDDTALISLTAASVAASGVDIAPQSPAMYHASQPALATVLAPEDLISARTALVAAQTHAEQAQATAQASGAAYERLRMLHEQDRDVSDKDFQAAEATWRNDEAALRAAHQAREAAQQSARQQWGTVLTAAAIDNSSRWERLITRDEVLLQITLPAGVRIQQAPQAATVRLPDGSQDSAALLSPAPRTDPRLQGISFFYTLHTDAQSTSALPPGAVLSASLPVGAETHGAMVPGSAVVWWQGRAWIYTMHAPGKFVRHELPTDNPTESGWFVPQGFAAGEPIVITGAQLLLSEEQRAQISVGEEGK